VVAIPTFLTPIVYFKIMAGAKKQDKVVGKKKRSKTRTLRTPIRRICKDASIHSINKDALDIVEGAFKSTLDGLIEHTVQMLENDKHRLTHKTATLAFIGYMNSVGAADDICREALERADTAKQNLFAGAK
jgi:histone H3/H4